MQPEIIAIEGDGIILKNKKKGEASEVHRLQVYEGVRKNGNRTELVGLRCFASTSRKELFAMAASYLHGHYDLSKTTVLSNGDGGSGYQFQDFEQMVEGCLDHQHFRDCYHVHEKIRTRLSFCKRELVDRIIRELHQTDDIMKRIPVWMDTARSFARTEADLEEVDKKMDRAMHKAVVQAERRMRNYRPGCLEGRIGVYGASSSPLGRLAGAIQKY